MVEPFKNLAWDDLRLIKSIAEARSLPAAAEQLGVNHSTVFRRLGQLEETMGTKLFERHRVGYTLTPVGEEMVGLAQRVDEDITAFMRKLAGREIIPAGELRVTTNDSLLIHLLTPLFAGFHRQCRDVRLDVVLANQELNLSKRDADVAIRATDSPPENLVGRRAATIAWALYGSAAAFPEPVANAPERLFEQDWVSLGDNFATFKAVKFIHEHVAPERVGYKVNTVLGMAEAIEQGIGIGHLPCFIGDIRPGLVRLGLPNPEFATGLWLLTHPDLRHSPRVRMFLDFLAAEIGKQRRIVEGATVDPESTTPQQ
ncbi:LysR family transcriptional regulator [Microvirga sp. BT688]|uniref:LysR family transcriptional regulator n=1 Tax=Microvirga sp. TaxID=1873136 RepID=UPI001688A7AD|nr:LysR family transcriptional regulator [Microvirga sp.]MBD2750908.1 LysR family transcriptional regulator [Microvirga sp.]